MDQVKWTDTMTALVAGYAAIVATGTLALEVRRWFESGPRLVLSVMSQARVYGGPRQDDREYITARITNRGALPTTVTNFCLLQFRNPLQAWRQRSEWSAVVPNPAIGHGPQLPHVLAPGTEWTGAAMYNDELRERAGSGKLYVAIYSSHRARASVRRVVLPKV